MNKAMACKFLREGQDFDTDEVWPMLDDLVDAYGHVTILKKQVQGERQYTVNARGIIVYRSRLDHAVAMAWLVKKERSEG